MIVVDMESSGLEPATHGLLSVGAVDFSNPNNQFYEECRLWEGAHIDPQALAVNGFTEVDAHEPTKQTDKELIEKFIAWAGQCPEKTIAGQNPSLDRDFLRAAAYRHHINWEFAHHTIDLHSVAYLHMVQRKERIPEIRNHSALSMSIILRYCGLPTEPRPHNGLNGAKYEAEAFSRLFYGKNFLPEFSSFAIPW